MALGIGGPSWSAKSGGVGGDRKWPVVRRRRRRRWGVQTQESGKIAEITYQNVPDVDRGRRLQTTAALLLLLLRVVGGRLAATGVLALGHEKAVCMHRSAVCGWVCVKCVRRERRARCWRGRYLGRRCKWRKLNCLCVAVEGQPGRQKSHMGLTS